ncbi:asparaginase [Nocardioides yefusunii]|uniref:Asparaginase n=1 Tax=Nocardioides yefusunii TaxID=2500546 RepID=A0ABW1QTU8_9ACTN|nr:asparaginase [Nocardioides yefusunii]
MDVKKTRAARLVRRACAATAAAAVGATCAVALVSNSDVADHGEPPAGEALQIRSVAYQQAVLKAADPQVKPKVTVVATGGTLAGKANGRTAYGSYRAGTYAIADMLDVMRPEVDAVADVDSVQFGNGGSSSYTIEKYRELTIAVEKALETADGVVVTTGTDTMEEFAYWLDLTVQSKKPVVITGAMRPWAAGATPDKDPVIGTDGPANLFNAVKLAAGQQTYCFGTVLMLNDEIHTAREVRKGNTTRMNTFETPLLGPAGWIDQSATTLRRAPARMENCDSKAWFTPFDMDEISAADLPKVEIAYAYQGASGAGITAAVDAGAKGIVTMGTGTGGLSGTMGAARTAAIAKDVWFTTTSRTGTGTASASSSKGMISAGDLQGPKARLLLLLSRAATADIAQARTWFNTIGNPQSTYSAE